MHIGYVSDERDLALADVLVAFQANGGAGRAGRWLLRSGPDGALDGDLPPGPYQVVLAKEGYGAKRVTVEFVPGRPYRFRLLTDGLLGYMWPKWVRSGESAELRVHSAEELRVSLWRCGWRQEPLPHLTWLGEHGPRALIQLTPDGDYSQSGVEFNRYGFGGAAQPSSTYTVFGATRRGNTIVAPQRSSLYYLHLETKGGATFSCPWVVAPAQPTAPIAVLASTNTWNAYNNFGGRSNYIHPNRLPDAPTVNIRLENDRYLVGTAAHLFRFEDEEYMPLSFDRPEPFNQIPARSQITDPIRGRNECHLAPAEWRLLGWLEREGYAYDLYADYQLHSGQLELDAYKVLVLNVHSEYWSREMYLKVKAWVT